MRIGGLASGMDIDTLVGDLMKAERMGMDKLKQKKQTLEWQRDDYRAMNTLLLNFRSELTQMKLSSTYKVRTTTSSDESKLTATATSGASLSSYSISKVEKLASAATKVNAGKISNASEKIDSTKGLYANRDKFAITEGTASDGNGFDWKAGSVESKTITAENAGTEFTIPAALNTAINSTEPVNIRVNGQNFKVLTTMPVAPAVLAENEVYIENSGPDLKLKFGKEMAKGCSITADYIADKRIETAKFSEDTKEFTVSKGSINELTIKAGGSILFQTNSSDPTKLMNAAGDTQVGTIDLETGKVTLNDPNKIDKNVEISVEYKQNYSTFNIGSHTSKGFVSQNFFIQGNQSLDNVINVVNTSQVGVSMVYDSFSDQVTLTRKETGNFNGKAVSEAGYGSLDHEILTTGGFINSVMKFDTATESGGQNAVFTINGLSTTRNSNTFEMNGVSFTLKQTFDGTTGPVTVAVNNDSNKVFENIKGFVEKYNELIGKIQSEVSETHFKDFKPLTEEQREQLSDKQQEHWEEKARSGMLRRDSILTSNLSKMRSDFYSPVTGEGINSLMNQLTSIGIKTSANYLEGGKLEIDEAKLKKAIETNPEDVEKILTANGSADSQKGIIHRLYDTVNNTMGKLKERAGNSFSTNNQFMLGKQLNLVDSQIDRFEDKLVRLEDRYWRQFTAMEKAIQQSNQQSAYLMQQFSGGN